jgi:hypothetical protein
MLAAYGEPNGDYVPNCYLAVYNFANLDALDFNDWNCNYHSSSYLCQSLDVVLCKVGTAPCVGGCPGGSYNLDGAVCVNCPAGASLTVTLTLNPNPLTLTP